MEGIVSPDGRLFLTVRLNDGSRSPTNVVFVVDTAFDGTLLLTGKTVRALSFTPSDLTVAIFADGSKHEVPRVPVTAEWHGEIHEIAATYVETAPDNLLGMSMLHGSNVFFEAVEGGKLRVERRL